MCGILGELKVCVLQKIKYTTGIYSAFTYSIDFMHTEVYMRSTEELNKTGLSTAIIREAITFVYRTLTVLDDALLSREIDRFTKLVERTTLSSLIGDLLRTGIVKSSNGLYRNNAPHTYPDILHTTNPAFDLELKVALGDNEPKGHLAKSGLYLTCHYVLQTNDIPQIWLLRFGLLQEQHFNISNTAGDSGKNAAINASGIGCLQPIYFAPSLCPLPITKRAKRAKEIFEAFDLHYPCK